MGRVSTAPIVLPSASTTLAEMGHAAAWWWVRHMRINGERHPASALRKDPQVYAFENDLADSFAHGLLSYADSATWTITHEYEQYPLFSRIAAEHNLTGVTWSRQRAMWLVLRNDIGTIIVRSRKYPHERVRFYRIIRG
jgi:hypothetical protein